MHVLAVHVVLPLLRLTVTTSTGSGIHSSAYTKVRKTHTGASPWFNNVHKVTAECGGYTNRRKIINQ